MDDKIRCQSCSVPLGDEVYGTNEDDSLALDYCKFCFQKGDFTDSDTTMEDMVNLSVKKWQGVVNE